MSRLPATDEAPAPRSRPSRSRAASTTVKVVGGFAIIIVAFLLLVHDTRTLLIESELAADDAAFPQYLATLVGNEVTEGDTFDVLVNGTRSFPP
jgi:hypothetical protein